MLQTLKWCLRQYHNHRDNVTDLRERMVRRESKSWRRLALRQCEMGVLTPNILHPRCDVMPYLRHCLAFSLHLAGHQLLGLGVLNLCLFGKEHAWHYIVIVHFPINIFFLNQCWCTPRLNGKHKRFGAAVHVTSSGPKHDIVIPNNIYIL